MSTARERSLPSSNLGGSTGAHSSGRRAPRAAVRRRREPAAARRRPRRRRCRPARSSAVIAPAASTAAPTSRAGLEPSTNACGRLEPARAAEHRRQHRHAEHAAELADRVGRARRLAGLLRADRAEHRVGGGREDERHAGAAHHERGHEQAVGDVRRGDHPDPARARRLQGQPGRHQRTRADPVGERARRAARRASACRSTAASAAPPRAASSPGRVWKNWASRKIDAEDPEVIASETPLVAANARERKKRIGSIGVRRAQLPGDERRRAATAPAASEATTTVEPQPAALPRTTP